MADEKHRRKGESDGATGRYNPPDGSGFGDILFQQVFGQSQADREYHEGYKKGQSARRKRGR